ncbi:hypothetical protein ACR6HW_08845 [Fusibacter sp. JL298sf-3]
MKSKNAIIWIYLGLVLLFTLFVIPVNKETGYLFEGLHRTYEKGIGVAPIWSIGYSIEVKEDDNDREVHSIPYYQSGDWVVKDDAYKGEVYRLTSINYYLHALSLIVITLCCGFYYFMTKSKPRE